MSDKSLNPTRWIATFAIVVIAGAAQASWLTGWTYRRPIEIANPCGVELIDHQINVRLDGAFDFTRAALDGSDVRVTDADGQTLREHWIETWDPGLEVASFWVRVPTLPAGGATLHLYYGRPDVTSTSDGHATFAAYDGFEDFGATGNSGEWARHPANPVLTEGPAGSWDSHGATFASVIWDPAEGEFRMYYHGFAGVHQIGLATSADGVTWSKHPGNPIMTPTAGAWDASSVRVPMVWKEGATYHMIYTGLGGGGFQIGYATSSDGIVWTKHPANPVFNDPTWAHGETENWGVMKVDDQYLMWYSDFGVRRAGIAVSTDLVNWLPYQPNPVFDTSGNSSDDRYSQFCPFSFKYGDDYYVLVPSYDAGSNYSKLYLYRSPSPFFPADNREIVRIAHTVGENGQWDDHDSDTPCVLTLDIQRTQFYNDELWCYYAGEGGEDYWKVGLHHETDIAAALTSVTSPPQAGITWTASGAVTTVGDPVRQGDWAILQDDAAAGGATTLTGTFVARTSGAVGVWLRRSSTTAGDYDIYLYGNGGATLTCVGGLGRDGDFHYYNGTFQPTGIAWAVNTWYLVTLAFDANGNNYDFIVCDESLAELVRVENIAFGLAATTIDRAMLYTSMVYVGQGYADDIRVRAWCGVDPGATVGAEEQGDVSTVPLPTASEPVLHQNRPNPLNPSTEIAYDLPTSGHVVLAIYDLQGRRVATLVDAEQTAGRQNLHWDGRDGAGRPVAAGVYLYRLRAGSFAQIKRLAIVR